jgi:Flp pilus assembly protein TadG
VEGRRLNVNMSWIRKIRRDDRASEIAEAALVLPIAFMVLLGIYWFGRAFDIYATINHAAREAARAGVAQSCGSCGNASQLAAQGTTIGNALQASGIDATQIQPYAPAVTFCPGFTGNTCTNPTGYPNVTVCNEAQLNPITSPTPVCGVVVSFQYPYQMSLPFTSLNMTTITMKADVQMQGEY